MEPKKLLEKYYSRLAHLRLFQLAVPHCGQRMH